jgi:hypothetical protein
MWPHAGIFDNPFITYAFESEWPNGLEEPDCFALVWTKGPFKPYRRLFKH